MSTAIQPAGPALPALRYGFEPERVELIKRQIAKGATNDELDLFLYNCQRRGLDPLSRQIYFVKRGEGERAKVSFQTAIDGFRLIADRTGKYAGSDDYRFDEGLNEYQHIQTERNKPVTATVTVYKIVQGQRVPFTATGRWDEYYPGDRGGMMWNKMPYLMLGKCVEALALRKAFPEELGGLYVTEEMEQANGPIEGEYREVDEPAATTAPEPEKLPEKYHNRLKELAEDFYRAGGNSNSLNTYVKRLTRGKVGFGHLTVDQATEIAGWLKDQTSALLTAKPAETPAAEPETTTTYTTDEELAALGAFDEEDSHV